MKITGTLVSTAALLVLGSIPMSARAQCGVSSGAYEVNEEEGTIDAWSEVQEFVLPGCPWIDAYQYGYYEHSYYVTAQITSPTQNVAHGEDYQIMPYGGGGAETFTSISYWGDPGVYDIDWLIWVNCTVGGTLGLWLDEEEEQPPPDPLNLVRVYLTFDDGPTSCCGSDHYTLKVLNTLANNPVQPNIKATFFVQTHVPNRLAAEGGISAMQSALSQGHDVALHNGWDVDHGTPPLSEQAHTYRITLPAYDGGANALESDLIRGKIAIDNLAGAPVPVSVRAPFGTRNPATIATYGAYGLEHKYWHVDSDDTGTNDPEEVILALGMQLPPLLLAGVDIMVLFHDVQFDTADNLEAYLLAIKAEAVALGRVVVFVKSPLPDLE